MSDANGRLGGHQQIRAWTVWPEDDFPRTTSMKVKTRLVLEHLASIAGPTASPAALESPIDASAPPRAQLATVRGLAAFPVPSPNLAVLHPRPPDRLQLGQPDR